MAPGRAGRQAFHLEPAADGRGRVHVRGQVRVRRDEVFGRAERVRRETGQRLVSATTSDIRPGRRSSGARRRRRRAGRADRET